MDFLDTASSWYDSNFPASSPSASAPTTTPSTDWGDLIKTGLQTYATIDQSRKLTDLNIQRAQQGLAPVNAADYSGLGVQVGLNTGTKTVLLILAAVLVGGLVFSTMMKTRKRR